MEFTNADFMKVLNINYSDDSSYKYIAGANPSAINDGRNIH